MGNNNLIQYFVEGECEEKFINVFKTGSDAFLKAGKVEVLNPVNKIITEARARTIKQNTTVVLVYDIDKGNIDVLLSNIKTLKNHSLTKIIHIQSVMNFEDEIVRSTSINSIDEMFSTKGVENFKEKFIGHKNIKSKLEKVKFDNSIFWSKVYRNGQFKDFAIKGSIKNIRKE
ncbi:MAG: hypothetical protein IJQ72_04920 [Bacilli bacterium]|nr:hypothetical protein [Bacilli bacterium]